MSKILHAAAQAGAGQQDGGARTIHDRVAMKEEGLQYHLLYDWYTRGFCSTIFWDPA